MLREIRIKVIRVGDQVKLVDNHLLHSLWDRRSNKNKHIPVGTIGVVVAFKYNEGQFQGEKLSYLVKFEGHGGLRAVYPENIKPL